MNDFLQILIKSNSDKKSNEKQSSESTKSIKEFKVNYYKKLN